jgi:hypothetical protein
MTLLNVSQTIKGDGHKPVIAVDSWAQIRVQLIEGQTVLAFMQRKSDLGASRDSYDLITGETSAKPLSPADLETYLRRIQELKEITARNDDGPSEIVEWLVRCAEDPATRREGAFELYGSALTEQFEKEQADAETPQGELVSALRRKARSQQLLFASLTKEQKERLVNALLKSDLDNAGDFDLVEIVRRWNDPRLAPFLISYLHRFEDTAPEYLWRVLRTVAELLDDKTLNGLSRNYMDNKPFDGLEADKDESAISDSDEQEEDEMEEESDEAEDADEDETVDTSDEADTAPNLTPEAAKQIRVELLKRFFAAAEAKMKFAATK